MIILGIDPGIAIVGYGVILNRGNSFKTINYGCIYTPAKTKLSVRLNMIFDGVNELIQKYKPDAISVEELFFNTNVKTAISVGHGRGVILLAGAQSSIDVYEYTPLQVKQAVVGYGRAQKKQVQIMTKALLNLDKLPKPDDAADALAVAVCHAHSTGYLKRAGL